MSWIIMLMCLTGILSSRDGFSTAIYFSEIIWYQAFQACTYVGDLEGGEWTGPLDGSSLWDFACLSTRNSGREQQSSSKHPFWVYSLKHWKAVPRSQVILSPWGKGDCSALVGNETSQRIPIEHLQTWQQRSLPSNSFSVSPSRKVILSTIAQKMIPRANTSALAV